MNTFYKAIRLAIILEMFSCLGMFFESNSRAVEDSLLNFFGSLNFPALLLLSHLRGDVGFEVHNGRLIFSSFWGVAALLVQSALWSVVFFGLLQFEKRLKLYFGRHDV